MPSFHRSSNLDFLKEILSGQRQLAKYVEVPKFETDLDSSYLEKIISSSAPRLHQYFNEAMAAQSEGSESGDEPEARA